MQRQLGPALVAMLVLLWPAAASGAVADPSAGWHGRAIEAPQPRPDLPAAAWPAGWSAGAVGPGTGYARPGGSQRVREVQRRLGRLGYRPGPVDGLFGPRTRAATRWFQYKHGLRVTGRVDRFVLTVLRARGDHRPLRPRTPAETPSADPPPPLPAPAAAPADDTLPVVALLIGALVLGLIAGLVAPDLRPRRRAPAPEPAPAPLRVAAQRPRVLGYALGSQDQAVVDATTATIAVRCARAGWHLEEVVQDEDAGDLARRAGLLYAVWKVRTGAANGLVVARLGDVAPGIGELAGLLRSLDEAGAFLASADHSLDTSTHVGRATARAVVELGRWERRRTRHRPGARFTPRSAPPRGELGLQIAAMQERGIPRHAIADALNLAGIPAPDRDRWDTADVKEVRRQG